MPKFVCFLHKIDQYSSVKGREYDPSLECIIPENMHTSVYPPWKGFFSKTPPPPHPSGDSS